MTKVELYQEWSRISAGWSESVLSDILYPHVGSRLTNSDYQRGICLLAMVERFQLRSGTHLQDVVTSGLDLFNFLPNPYRAHLSCGGFSLAARYSDVSSDTRRESMESYDWIATEKVRGIRGMLYWSRGDVPYLFGRGYADDGGLLDWSDLVCGLTNGLPKPKMHLVLDVEVCLGGSLQEVSSVLGWNYYDVESAVLAVLRSSPDVALSCMDRFKQVYGRSLLVFKLLSPVIVDGVDYTKCPQMESWDVYDVVLQELSGCGLCFRPILRQLGGRAIKSRFLDFLLASGGEGIVLRNGAVPYDLGGCRSSSGWLKLKTSLDAEERVAPVPDTFDVVIGSVESFGNIVQFSLIGDIRDCEGFITPKFFGTVSLSGVSGQLDSYVGKVVEVGCDGFTDSFRMINPRVVRMRYDKPAHSVLFVDYLLRRYIR